MAASLCSRTEAELSAYLDGELAAPQRAAVEAHLANCAACRQMLAELREVVGWVGGLPRARAPVALVEELRGLALRRQGVRVIGAKPRASGALVSGWVIARRFGAVAAAVLICVMFGRVTIDSAGPRSALHNRSARPNVAEKPAAPGSVLTEADRSDESPRAADALVDAAQTTADAAAPSPGMAYHVDRPGSGDVVRRWSANSANLGAGDTQKGSAPEQTAGRSAGMPSGQPPIAAALLREPTVHVVLHSADAAEYQLLRRRVAELPVGQDRHIADVNAGMSVAYNWSHAPEAPSAEYGESVLLAVRPQELRPLIREIELAAPSAVEVSWRWDRASLVESQTAPAVATVPAEESNTEALAFESDADGDAMEDLARKVAPPPAPPVAAGGRIATDSDTARPGGAAPRREGASGDKHVTATPQRPASGGEPPPAAVPAAPAAKSRAAPAPPAAPAARVGEGRGFAGEKRDNAANLPAGAGGDGSAIANAPAQPPAAQGAAAGRAQREPRDATAVPPAMTLQSLVPDAVVRMFDDVVARGLDWLDALEPTVTVRITILPPQQVGPPAPPEALLPAAPPASNPIGER